MKQHILKNMQNSRNNNSNNNDNNNNNNNNNIIIIIIAFKCANRDFLPSPHCTANREQITGTTSSAFHVQQLVLRATWYEGTAQLLSLTEFKSHLCLAFTRVTHYVLQSGFWTTPTTTLSTPILRGTPWACTHLTIRSNQLSMTADHVKVCPKWRPQRMLGHLRRSETAFPSAVIWRKGTKTSHRGQA